MNKKIIKRAGFIIGILLILWFIFEWPYMIIGLAALWLVRLVRSGGKYQNIQLAFISFIIVLSAVEIYFRVDGKYTSYPEQNGRGYLSPFGAGESSWYHVDEVHYTQDDKYKEFSVLWTANNEGFKDIDFVVPKNKMRIIAIGDSYTEGVGADNDSSLPKQLGYILRDSFPRPTEVWNCGIAGSDMVYEFRLFHDKLLPYKPDMVIVVVNSSDINDVIYRGGFERFHPDGTTHYRQAPWYMPFYANSYIVRRIVHDGFRYDWDFIPVAQEARVKAGAIHILTNAMDSFTRICTDRNIKLLFAIQPTWGDFTDPSKYDCKPLVDYCVAKRLPYVDIKAELYRQGWDSTNGHQIYWTDDGHCKNKGYYYYARCIWRRVVEILNQ